METYDWEALPTLTDDENGDDLRAQIEKILKDFQSAEGLI